MMLGGGQAVAAWQDDKPTISTFELVMSILGDTK